MTTTVVNPYSEARMPSVHEEATKVDESVYMEARELQRQVAMAEDLLTGEYPDCYEAQRIITRSIEKLAELEAMGKLLHAHGDRTAIELMASTVRRGIDAVSARLAASPMKALLKEQSRWVEAGFPQESLTVDPEAVHFVVATDLMYTVMMYQKCADILEGESTTLRFVDGKVLIKVEGEYLPYADIKEKIRYSSDEKKFCGWNMIHPMGFVPCDATSWNDMYPIARLTPEAYQRVAARASQFWSEDQEEIDPGREKGYILQVITTGRSCLPHAWWNANFNDMTPEHTSSRLITPDGYVFSFGTKMAAADAEQVTQLSGFLTTAASRTSCPDYEEVRPSHEKRVTSIPMTKERFDAIVQYAKEMNKGFAFNFASQNCARFVTVQMALAGVFANIKMSLSECLYGMLPRLRDIPFVGQPVARVAAAISFVVTPIFDLLAALIRWVTPYPVKRVWEVVTSFVREALRRMCAVIINALFFFVMGAGKTLIPKSRCLLRWQNLANPDAIVVYHAYKLRQWQARQLSSVYYTKPEAGLCCLDPEKGWVPALQTA